MTSFGEIFGHEPAATGIAPGRVNLLGEHTDYNDGFVLPTVIPQVTRVEVGQSRDRLFHAFSAALDETADFAAGGPVPVGFSRYLHGCIAVLAAAGTPVPPLAMHVSSDVPIGAGLSSSAALEVATLRALRRLLHLDLSDPDVALLAHRAETEYAGVACGIMDQFACSLGNPGSMLLLDTRTLEYRELPIPAGIIVVDSGTPRSLAGTAYNDRRRECEEAARLAGVPALRDIADPLDLPPLPAPLDRRARHVVSENRRVLAAADASAARFGQLMNDSHASLRDDFEVSTPALDLLAGSLQRQPGVFGARLTGAGFGGACVALVTEGMEQQAADAALTTLQRAGLRGRRLV